MLIRAPLSQLWEISIWDVFAVELEIQFVWMSPLVPQAKVTDNGVTADVAIVRWGSIPQLVVVGRKYIFYSRITVGYLLFFLPGRVCATGFETAISSSSFIITSQRSSSARNRFLRRSRIWWDV